MNAILESLDTTKPLNSLFPWDNMENQDNLEFRNLQHFTYTVGKLKQIDDQNCGISYADAFKSLQLKTPQITKENQESIRNLVRSNLHKRGLITEEIYEEFKYATDGTQVGIDVGKYAAGEADCVITPSRQYVDFFHELFISISYRWDIEDEDIIKNTAKLLSTVEELERQHIFIKITLILPVRNPTTERNFFLSIPLFSHKEFKSIETMSAIVNERLLRKFCFAILEGFYGKDLEAGYGHPTDLTGAMNLGDTFDEIAFFEEIKTKVGA